MERLEYDVATQRIELEGQDEVFLIHGGNEIHARNIQYESAGPGKIGQVVGAGAGLVPAQMSDGFGSLQGAGTASCESGPTSRSRWLRSPAA